MKVLITGTAGFIGFHLVTKLHASGFEIVGLDNINNYYDVRLKYDRLKEHDISKKNIKFNTLIHSKTLKNYRFVQLNLEDKQLINSLFKTEKFEIVIHLAAQAGVRYSIENPYSYINSNIMGFMNIIEGCRNFPVKHLYYASSSSVYGGNNKAPFEEIDNVDNPTSLYAATKKANELIATSYHKLYNISCTGMRFFTVYGPWGRPDMAYYLFTKAILDGDSIKVFNNGNLKRDFTYIDDIINSIYLLIEKDMSLIKCINRLLNIGNNKSIKLLEFISKLESSLNKKAKMELLPMQKGDVLQTYANIDKLVKITGYRPRTNLDEGLEKFTFWYNNYITSL